jgi:UDP-2,4-diacetamido-2,4,6-trideoxy-beta-L-altropyranose hydrolase
MSGELALREATAADCEWVFALANDRATREASFHSEPIAFETHVRWFEATLASTKRRLFIAQGEQGPVGIIRFDLTPTEPPSAEIGIAIAPERRGHGLSRTILASATETARALGIVRLVARIKPSNTASTKAFQAVGYRLTGDEVVAGNAALRYELEVA